MDLYIRVKNKISKYISRNDSVLACVSGGTDSAAMLNILDRLKTPMGFKLYAAHFNHKLRGRESDRDADFVKALCLSYGIPFTGGGKDIKKAMKKSGFGPEKTAREERYRFFLRCASLKRNNKIALAHTLDDNIETILFRFIKGAGREGLAGIPPERRVLPGGFGVKMKKPVNIIRPLIEESKKDITKYMKKEKLAFVNDSTNRENIYTRNRIRNKLIPYIEKNFNKNLKQTLSGTASIMASENEFIASAASSVYPELVKKRDKSYYIDTEVYSAAHRAVRARVIKLLLENALVHHRRITFNLINDIDRAVLLGKSLNLPEDYVLSPAGGKARMSKKKKR